MEQITITAKVQIVATDTDKVLLNKTMSVYCDACNYVSDYVFRTQLLQGSIADDVKQKILDIANTRGYEIIAMETDKDHIHFLLSYDATDRVCDIVKIVKQETTYYLWQKYNSVLSKQYWKKKIFWSDGYFACSIGEVSSATIQKYIESQG